MYQVRIEGAIAIFILPVTESEYAVLIRATAEEDYNAHYDESSNRNEFNAGKPELCFSKECDLQIDRLNG